MIAAQTLQEKYYAMNSALNAVMVSFGVRCPVVKFGADPATVKAVVKDQTASRWPYMQSFILNPKVTAWTSDRSGIYTRFEYQLSFFTSPDNEFENDADLFKPYNLARMAFSDVSLKAFLRVDALTGASVTIADLLRLREETSFSMVSGAPVPKAVMTAEMAAVCGYPAHLSDPGISTDLDHALAFTDS